jgi:hypothetical protein
MSVDSSSQAPHLPTDPSLADLRALIEQVANGRAPVETLIASFRGLHEAIERKGRPQYKNKEEARLIWDVLWALEFYSPDPATEPNPHEWNDAAAILAEVRRVGRRLKDV